MADTSRRVIASDFDRLCAKAADPYYRLKAAGVTAGAARKISFEDAGCLMVQMAETKCGLRVIEAQCQLGAKKAGRS